ncbi:unnamed protein product [Blepharisma stoltei]|uniref:Tc1-like transposase DDE domain-containing protein n=1 Tax=Blepharisma stoltei TaxID=1481888 RepID=A0AAU9J463_9CILI|nr:unnamed protein product [Blepharisma stoltei]
MFKNSDKKWKLNQPLIKYILHQQMVKQRPIKKAKTKNGVKEPQLPINISVSSDLINPYIERNREEILDACRFKNFRVSLPEEDGFFLPPNYIYTHHMDFLYKTDSPEDPLSPSEISEYCKYADDLMTSFLDNAPDYHLTLNVLNYPLSRTVTIGDMINAIKISPYNIEFKSFLADYEYSTINKLTKRPKDEELIMETINYLKRGLSIKETYQKMRDRVSLERVREIHRNYKLDGKKYINRVLKKKISKLRPEHISFLKEISEDPRNTVLTGRERKLLLCHHFGIKIRTDEVRRALKDMGYSMKRVRGHVPEADRISHKNARCRVVQQLILLQREGKQLISIDECQVNRGETAYYGWSKEGQKAMNICGRKGPPLQIVVACSSHKLLGYMVKPNKVNEFGYKHFLQAIIGKLKEMDENYKEKYFLFMDNASAHKTKMIKDFCELEGITVLCNAPMTPQLNPIEYIFSMFKNNLRRLPMSEHNDLIEFIYHAFRKIRSRHIYNTYIHAIRSYKPALMFESMHDPRGHSRVEAHIKFAGRHVKTLINFAKLQT